MKQFWKEAWQGSVFVKFYRSRKLFYLFLIGWASMAFTTGAALLFEPLSQRVGKAVYEVIVLTAYFGSLLVPISLMIFAVTDVWADIREMWRRR